MKIDIVPKFIDEAATPIAKSVGKTLDSLWSLVFGGINFYADKVNTKRAHSLQLFKEELEEEVSSIPEESLVEPPLHIIGPTMEASKFYFESEELRSMFANLIAASINAKTLNKTHPAFVECIKQLSPVDAKNLKLFKPLIHEIAPEFAPSSLPIVNYHLLFKKSSNFAPYKNNVFLSNTEIQDIDLNSTSVTNLNRLGLVEIQYGTSLISEHAYTEFECEPLFKQTKKVLMSNESSIAYQDIVIEKGIIFLTPLGTNFVQVCI